MAQRLAFIAEWVDPNSGVLWKYQFFWYESHEIEMFDIKNRRHFLRRTKFDGITQQQLFIGSVIVVYARQLRLTDYGDEFTRKALESRSERTLAIIKPDAVSHMGKIINAITTSGFTIVNLCMCQLSREQTKKFYEAHCDKPFYDNLTGYMSCGPVVALEIMAAGGIKKWRELLGPTDSNLARQQAPNSIRGMFGTDGTRNAAHGSDSPQSAAAELAFFFGSEQPCSISRNPSCSVSQVSCCARCDGTTLGVIKPHAVRDGLAGILLDCIQDAFDITGLQLFNLERTTAAEFLEVYKGVVAPAEFNGMVDELTAGPCIAVEVAARDSADPVESFRQLCGPHNPELGRLLRPDTLRARFGLNTIKNAIHCTDLPEDGQLETEYFFRILQRGV